MKANVWKNFLWMWRNVGVMLFIIGLPVAQIILFCLAVGHDPVGLGLAVTNYELDSAMIDAQECPTIPGCNYTMLSCRYLKFLKDKQTEITYFGTNEDAYEYVRRGHAWGSLIFSSNYSAALFNRTELGTSATDSILNDAIVQVKLDMSSKD